MPHPSTARVWDLPIRLFHWALAISVAVAAGTGFLGGAGAIRWHLGAGLLAVGLVLARIVWGFTGTTHARFADFLPRSADVAEHLKPGAARHLGHNPLGALMVFALIAAMLVIGIAGLAALGGMLKTGPLAFWSFDAGRLGGRVHELAAWGILGLVLLHLGGVLFESVRGRENLARSMLTGEKQRRPSDHAARAVPARVPVALFLVGLVGAVLWAVNASLAARPVVGVPVAMHATVREECSACHMAFHPSLLPAASWRGLMAGLPDHFGEDASLDADTAAEIEAWLVANAAETADTLPAHVFRTAAAAAPFRLTDSTFWTRRHGGLPETVFESPAVKSRGNCVACHADAESGFFSPFSITVPKE